ncbi:hypothetical protein MA16_Dca003873 [Dendrobium catenatum]|uniref:Uncharacterized protein n=1 Tax=Dendrobium catenatum TaxID=906689 RepID=A0A2I0X1U2_9ASPA|nr:hypothetical protein MA16_Dca003873 [Dendrobium catenatum]
MSQRPSVLHGERTTIVVSYKNVATSDPIARELRCRSRREVPIGPIFGRSFGPSQRARRCFRSKCCSFRTSSKERSRMATKTEERTKRRKLPSRYYVGRVRINPNQKRVEFGSENLTRLKKWVGLTRIQPDQCRLRPEPDS